MIYRRRKSKVINSRFKVNKERGEYLLLTGLILIMLGLAVGDLKGYIGYISWAVSTSGLWVIFGCLRSRKWITPPKWVLRLFLTANVLLSIASIIMPIGRIFWQW